SGFNWIFGLPVLILFSLLAYQSFRRRFEYAADAEAVAMTGDPESLISGFTRLMKINMFPMQWGRFGEQFLSHPSTLRRAHAIAAIGGVSPDRMQEIIDAPEMDEEQYDLSPIISAQERIFSTTFRSKIGSRVRYAFYAVMTLTPALIATLMRFGNLQGT